MVDQAGDCREAGKRRLAYLNQTGVIMGGGDGRLENVVTLAPKAITRVEAFMERWAASWAGA